MSSSSQSTVTRMTPGGTYTVTEKIVSSSSGTDVQNIQAKEWKTVTTQKVTTSADGRTTTTTVVRQEGSGTLPEDFTRQFYVTDKKSIEGDIFMGPGTSKAPATKPTTKPMSPDAFAKDCLEAHNTYRAKHGVPPIKLSTELCKYAEEWVVKLAREDRMQHRPSPHKYGENIFMKWSSDPNYQITGTDPVASWYSEIKDHVFGKEPLSLKSGHFTQVVWKDCKEMGVAQAKSKSGKILVVANYSPPGNMIGSFSANVPRPL